MTPRAGPLRVLVVDDDPATLRFLHASLESQGYIVATAADAHTALDMVRTWRRWAPRGCRRRQRDALLIIPRRC